MLQSGESRFSTLVRIDCTERADENYSNLLLSSPVLVKPWELFAMEVLRNLPVKILGYVTRFQTGFLVVEIYFSF
jgi:hypothetical protein